MLVGRVLRRPAPGTSRHGRDEDGIPWAGGHWLLAVRGRQ